MSYEEQQAKLQVLWNEMLSDESGDFSPDVSEYEPSSASVDGDDQFASNKGSRAKKRTKKLHVVGPSKKKPQLSVNEQNKTKMLNTTCDDDVGNSSIAVAGLSGIKRSTIADDAVAGSSTSEKNIPDDTGLLSEIDEIIENVITQNAYNTSSDSDNENAEQRPTPTVWGRVSDSTRRQFDFTQDQFWHNRRFI
ncbi:hypothetical protein MTP99_017331 [Tenebrio molitor]|jgi:hypothetical protein|nr:hypothetical protein MTP99_017331 [Tenebrio molitor]